MTLLLANSILFLNERQEAGRLKGGERRPERDLDDPGVPTDFDPTSDGRAIHHLRNGHGKELRGPSKSYFGRAV
jgi:hypothetical protein